ncbi:response regulator [Alistipes sp.]|uniref:response regulator n=1 Tax=Alistipes sp. TaxID=1872444 RepID=UPI003AF1A2F8
MHRILIVSDDAFLRDLVRLSLLDIEAEVRCASDGQQMQRLCRKVLFDLVIVLRVAPFLCGDNPVRDLRPQGLRRPSFYVVSWQQSEQTVLSLLECGVDQYMTFPVSLQRLRRKVGDFLTRQL